LPLRRLIPRANGATNPGADGGSTADGGGGVGAAPSATECGPTPNVCLGWNKRAACTDVGGKAVWTESTCPAGQGCEKGLCVASACSDECRLGESGCRVYDAPKGSYASDVDTGKMHDRARKFERWIRSDTKSYLNDQIVSVKYTGADRSTVASVYIGDSTLHTGIYLAAESHRLMATGSYQARKNVRDMVELFHVLFNVAGQPGVLATSVFPASDTQHRTWTNWSCAQFDRKCNVTYDGKKWDYVSDPSRDMYMGPLLGLPAAYDALGAYDDTLRKAIRKDLMTFATELVKKRTLPVRLVINGAKLPVENKEARFFIPDPVDFVDGAVEVVASTGDVTDGGDIRGGQEFMPNPAVFFRQFAFPGFASLPDTPRAGSALMVGGVIQAALHVTKGAPEWAKERADLLAFYTSNADKWGNVHTFVDLAAQVSADNSCDARYFGTHINWVGAYSWGLYEEDAALRTEVFTEAIDKLWSGVSTHKNSFMSFGYELVKKGGLSGTPRTDAVRQIDDFPSPPRVRVTKSGSCNSTAAEIGDRPVSYLTWHSNPWNRTDSGSPGQTYPGHDYLVGYWLGRTSGAITEDTPGRCLRQ